MNAQVAWGVSESYSHSGPGAVSRDLWSIRGSAWSRSSSRPARTARDEQLTVRACMAEGGVEQASEQQVWYDPRRLAGKAAQHAG